MRLTQTALPGGRLDSTQPADWRIFLILITAIWLSVAMLSTNRAHAADIDLETRTKLQFVLKQYIDNGTVGGRYDHFDVEQGKVEKLRLKNLHPVIFAMDSKYMMCADFLNSAGDSVMLDYIVGSSTDGFRVEQEIPGRRGYLQQFFERLD